MADEREKIEYQFTGDTSSLSESVQKAIGLLDGYGNRIKAVAKKAANFSTPISKRVKDASATLGTLVGKAKQAAQGVQKAFKSNNNLNDLSNPIAQFSKNITDSVSRMRTIFDPIVKKMQALKMKASNSFLYISKLAGTNASAFRRAAKASDDDSNSAQRNIKVTKLLQGAKDKLRKTVSKLPGLFNNASKSVDNLGRNFNKAVTNGLGLKSLFMILTGYNIGNIFATSIKEAIHYVEVLNMFKVVTGDSAEEMTKFVTAAQEMYGLDPTNIMEITSQFYNLASAVEAPAEASKKMAEGLTATAINLSSLFDRDFEKVAQDLTSGMQGMTRAVRKYGLDLRMATLEQTALAYGLKIDADTTSEANRQALRYLTIVRQASRATGDFAKTIESPANQLRVLKEQFSQLARAIGNFFLPVLQKVLPYLNGIVMAIRTILQFISQLMGIGDISFGGMTDAAKEMDNVKSGVAGIGDAANSTKKKMKDLLAPFDELNILNEKQQDAAGGAGAGVGDDLLDPKLAKALEELEVKLDKVRMKANDVRDAILGFLGLNIDDEGNVTEVIGGYFNRIRTAWQSQDYYSVGSVIAEVLNQGLYWALENVNWASVQESVKQTVDTITGLYNGFMQNYEWTTLGVVIGQGINIGIYSAQEFIQKLDWSALGTAFAHGINGIVSTVDWAALAETISQGLAGLLTTVYTWLQETDWQAIGAAVTEFVCGIDWSAVATAVFQTIGAAFGALAGFLWGLLKSAWKKVMGYWEEQATDDGVGIITSFFQGILNALVDLATWIYNNIFKPFVDGFKKAFEIHSPSKVMQRLGGQLVDGFMLGLENIFSKLSTWIANLKTKVVNGLNGVLSTARSIASSIASAVSGAASDVKELATKAYDAATEAATKAAESKTQHKTGANTGKKTPTTGKTTKLATGGVVTSPTYALIGEGSYPEAVVPLGNSPQMQELINKIAESIDNKPDDDNTPIQVTMYLDGNKIYKSTQKASRKRGVNFKMGAFER